MLKASIFLHGLKENHTALFFMFYVIFNMSSEHKYKKNTPFLGIILRSF